eukprot:5151274-Pyramimonas_sp.AAC.1
MIIIYHYGSLSGVLRAPLPLLAQEAPQNEGIRYYNYYDGLLRYPASYAPSRGSRGAGSRWRAPARAKRAAPRLCACTAPCAPPWPRSWSAKAPRRMCAPQIGPRRHCQTRPLPPRACPPCRLPPPAPPPTKQYIQ